MRGSSGSSFPAFQCPTSPSAWQPNRHSIVRSRTTHATWIARTNGDSIPRSGAKASQLAFVLGLNSAKGVNLPPAEHDFFLAPPIQANPPTPTPFAGHTDPSRSLKFAGATCWDRSGVSVATPPRMRQRETHLVQGTWLARFEAPSWADRRCGSWDSRASTLRAFGRRGEIGLRRLAGFGAANGVFPAPRIQSH